MSDPSAYIELMDDQEKSPRSLSAEEKRRAREEARQLIKEAKQSLREAQEAFAEARAYRSVGL